MVLLECFRRISKVGQKKKKLLLFRICPRYDRKYACAVRYLYGEGATANTLAELLAQIRHFHDSRFRRCVFVQCG